MSKPLTGEITLGSLIVSYIHKADNVVVVPDGWGVIYKDEFHGYEIRVDDETTLAFPNDYQLKKYLNAHIKFPMPTEEEREEIWDKYFASVQRRNKE